MVAARARKCKTEARSAFFLRAEAILFENRERVRY
jgi:hypothetical protein